VIPPIGPDSALPAFDRVFADIGDRQSISASLSTFSGHVAAVREILAHAGPGSLVLLDEIGSGTDPAEGGALAGAVLLALTRRRVVTLATTHLGSLKRLATQSVGVVNASLQFDAETLTPTYRLLKGVPGRSYGLAIARRLGVEAPVLAEAERAVPQAERELDALVADVERRAVELDARRAEVEQDAAALRDDRARVDARGDAVAERERAVRERADALDADARERARAYLLEARKTVEAALATARAAVDEATAREARRMVEEALAKTEAERRGETEKDGAGGGWMSLEELRRRRSGSSSPSRPAAPRPSPSYAAADAGTEVSLRGMRVDEAEAALVQALDAAVLADLPYLRVIHGKGTGTLRDLVHDLLGRDPRVASFALAPPNQGGHGVTVAELRR
jgi:DNA mismatch repair protein MutS2